MTVAVGKAAAQALHCSFQALKACFSGFKALRRKLSKEALFPARHLRLGVMGLECSACTLRLCHWHQGFGSRGCSGKFPLQLECRYGIRAQQPHMAWVLGPNSGMHSNWTLWASSSNKNPKKNRYNTFVRSSGRGSHEHEDPTCWTCSESMLDSC